MYQTKQQRFKDWLWSFQTCRCLMHILVYFVVIPIALVAAWVWQVLESAIGTTLHLGRVARGEYRTFTVIMREEIAIARGRRSW